MYIHEKRFQGGLVFKAHRWLHDSTLDSRAKKKEEPAHVHHLL